MSEQEGERENKDVVKEEDNVNDLYSASKTRMYEKEYPDADELVLVQVKNVAEMGAYVSLVEYNNIEGMILLSELSRRRIRSMNKVIRVGRQEVVVVMRVDKEKGYIDLSKRRVSEEEIAKCEHKFNMSKQAHSIMAHVAGSCKIPLLQLYKDFGWSLSTRYGHIYEAFKLCHESDEVLGMYNLPEKVKNTLLTTIRRRLAPQPFRIRADIEVTCFDYEGIDAIKAALIAGQDVDPTNNVKIKLVAPPLYVILHTCLAPDVGLKLLEKVIETIGSVLKSKGGHIVINEAPRVVSDNDEKKLNDEMKTIERQNQLVAADDAEDC